MNAEEHAPECMSFWKNRHPLPRVMKPPPDLETNRRTARLFGSLVFQATRVHIDVTPSQCRFTI